MESSEQQSEAPQSQRDVWQLLYFPQQLSFLPSVSVTLNCHKNETASFQTTSHIHYFSNISASDWCNVVLRSNRAIECFIGRRFALVKVLHQLNFANQQEVQPDPRRGRLAAEPGLYSLSVKQLQEVSLIDITRSALASGFNTQTSRVCVVFHDLIFWKQQMV